VDTVISCVFSFEGFVEGQTKLIQACVDAGVKRFVPSEWAHDAEKYLSPPVLSPLPFALSTFFSSLLLLHFLFIY
jgi:hypothetical protein